MINKVNLPARAAEHLKEQISQGIYQEYLPSERKLCRDLRLSRTTVRAAIKILKEQGLLVSSQGKSTCISRSAGVEEQNYAAQTRSVVVLSPTPLERQRPYNILWIDALRSSLHDAGYSLQIHADERLTKARNTTLLRRIVNEAKPACWVLLHSVEKIQHWFQENKVPCVVAGNCDAAVNLPRVSMDFQALTLYSLHEARKAGCRRISVFIENNRSPGSLIIENTIGQAKANPAFSGVAIDLIHVHQNSTEDVVRAVRRLKLLDEKQGIFVPNPLLCLTAVSESMRIGMSVEKLYAATSFFESLLQYLRPTPSSFEFNHKLFARKLHAKIAQVVSKAPITKPMSLIVPNHIKGDF